MPSLVLKIFSSHPVQYHVPFFRALQDAGITIDVGYYHQGSAGRATLDRDFGIPIQWDLDLLGGYAWQIFHPGIASYSLREQLHLLPKLLGWALCDDGMPLLLMGWFAEIVWLAWLLRVLLRRPVLMLSETTPLSFAFHPKPAWRVGLLRFLLRRTNIVLFTGQRNRQFYESMGVKAQNLFFTPYSIDNARFTNKAGRLASQKAELRRAQGLDPDLPVFLFCGKLIPKKRPLELLDAYLAAGLRDKAQLLYVGDGFLHTEIEQRAAQAGAGHVCVTGFFNQTRMPEAYVLGDLLCLLSGPDETWGLVVNEALACGLPVIVSDAVGCGPDLVSPANGWVVPLDDQPSLISALAAAYEQREHWAQMGQTGMQVVATYQFTTMAQGVCDALYHIQRHQFVRMRGLGN